MPSLNFTVFVSDVEKGYKLQTIRPRRKIPIKVWDTLYLKEGMRTKACRSLGEGVCVVTFSLLRNGRGEWARVWKCDGGKSYYTEGDIRRLATWDGFAYVEAFEDWFDRYKTPTVLDVIRWRLVKGEKG